VSVLYRRPTDHENVLAKWHPQDEQAAGEALARVLDGVGDETEAVEQAPHDLDRETAKVVREEYAAIMEETN